VKRGHLVVFEGADGVGKSASADHFQTWLAESGVDSELLSFPGKKEGTLGKLVYELHACPEQFHVSGLTPASLQALHIAAHLDAIEKWIAPSVQLGKTVILDRFWWSTYVYGIVSGVDYEVLQRMIATEKAAWGGLKPTTLFLIDRSQPLRPEPPEIWHKCRDTYRELLAIERTQYPCETISNEGTMEETQQQLIRFWKSHLANRDSERFRS
jgi:thymidylate kinase